MKRKNLRFCSRQRREERRESERERERRKAEEKNTQSGAAAAAAVGKGNARADTYYLLLIHPSRNELYVQKNSSDNGHSLIDYLFISSTTESLLLTSRDMYQAQLTIVCLTTQYGDGISTESIQ